MSIKAYAAVSPDMKGATVKFDGEWAEADLNIRCGQIVGDIVTEWIDKTTKHFGGWSETISSASVAHGEEICAQFSRAGYRFAQISYKDSDDDQRRALIDEFRKPDSDIIGLVSCEALFSQGLRRAGHPMRHRRTPIPQEPVQPHSAGWPRHAPIPRQDIRTVAGPRRKHHPIP